MSIIFDAQAEALKAYPKIDQEEDAVKLMLVIIGCSYSGFRLDQKQSPEQYLEEFRGEELCACAGGEING